MKTSKFEELVASTDAEVGKATYKNDIEMLQNPKT